MYSVCAAVHSSILDEYLLSLFVSSFLFLELIWNKYTYTLSQHVDAGFEDVSIRGAADTGDEGCEFVEEVDDPAG